MALIIRSVLEDVDLSDAIERAVARLKKEPGHEECVTALEKAGSLWDREGRDADIEKLGAGWVLDDYAASHIPLVWVIDPKRRTVMVIAMDAPVRWLRDGDALGAGGVVPVRVSGIRSVRWNRLTAPQSSIA